MTPEGVEWESAGMGESPWLVAMLLCQTLSPPFVSTEEQSPGAQAVLTSVQGGEGEEWGASGVASF